MQIINSPASSPSMSLSMQRIAEIAERRKLVTAELATIKSTLKDLNKDADEAKRETFRLAMAK